MDIIRVSITGMSLILLLAVLVFASPARLQVNPVFTAHMVLQRDMPLEIFGTTGPGKRVTVEIAGRKASGIADGYGEWTVKLEPLTAGGPREMIIRCGKETITLEDILAGDVWFCSGQSNMEWTLANTSDGAEELKNFKPQPNIRLFLQQQIPSPKPLKKAAGEWTECNSQTAANFSAIAYFFAKNFQKENNIPIGLIDSAWGGTPIEIWMKESLLKGNPKTQPILDRWKNNPAFSWKMWNNGAGMNYKLEISGIKFSSSSGKAEPAYVNVTYNADTGYGGTWSSWAKPQSTAVFEGGKKSGILSGIIGFNAWAGAGTALKGGAEADLSMYDTLSFRVKGNGKFSVGLTQKTIADYDYYSTPDYDASKKETVISIPIASLKQAGWGLAKPFTQNAIVQLQFNIKSMTVELPSALYNGMVTPFARYKIKGALWYQGENNAWKAAQYKVLLPLMIKNWREIWNIGDFPFLVVQLTNFMERKSEPGDSAWAELREAQLKALDLPNTAVVPIIDLGDAKDIHPRYKEPVAARLAHAALVMLNLKDPPATGPIYDRMEIAGNKVTIRLKNVRRGLEAKNGELKGFAIAGEDRVFKWAKAEIRDDTVIVWNDVIKEPKAVRYAWADNPECNLYNKEGLAASPFRTDDWPGLGDNDF